MGRPKAWLPVGDELMLQRVVRVLSEVVNPVIVVAAPRQNVPPLPGEVGVVLDQVEGQGPLGGLAAGLAAMQGRAEMVYVSACDVPLLRCGFVRRVLTHLSPGGKGVGGQHLSPADACGSGTQWTSQGRGSFAVAVPRIADFFHPLAAVYRVDLLPVVRQLLASGQFKMTALFDTVPTRVLTEVDFADVDPHLESLRNVNTPEEYERLFSSPLGERNRSPLPHP
jgi:molybdopterin-guanine dinucleotide biosynthesis protein A